MKLSQLLDLWKRDDYWFEKLIEEEIDEKIWSIHIGKWMYKDEVSSRHFGIFAITDKDGEIIQHGMLSCGFCLNPEGTFLDTFRTMVKYGPEECYGRLWPADEITIEGGDLHPKFVDRQLRKGY